MKAIILAAGYGTRLLEDAKECGDEKLKRLILSTPKPLLPVKGKPIIEYIVSMINSLDEVDKIFIVTNGLYYRKFNEWIKDYKAEKPIEIINDSSKSNDTRLGAIKDIDLIVKKEKIDDDCFIIGGDNLTDFDIRKFTDYSDDKNATTIAIKDLGDKDAVRKRFGVVELDDDNKIINFEEKPEEPRTSLTATCIYLIKRKDLGLIDEYLKDNVSDAPGYFILWLYKQTDIYGFIFDKTYKWFDVGNLGQYKEAWEKW